MQRYRSHTTKEPIGFIYIMTNISRTTLYIGVTRNLNIRVNEHRESKNPDSFTSKYNCVHFIYYEYYNFLTEAIAREKQLKNWKRAWKDELIAKQNPKLKDLYADLISGELGSDDLYY